MFSDRVAKAIKEQGLGSFHVVEEPQQLDPSQPKPIGPEAQKLEKQGRIYRDRGNALDNQAAIEHGYKRTIKLRREAKVCHDIADRYFEEAKVLSHYGAKGMKWGVRRTKKQRAAARAERASAKAKKAEDKANLVKTKASATKAKAEADQAKASASKAASEAKVAEAKANQVKTKIGKKTKKLSDGELRSAIQRMEMEKKYNSLNAEKKSKTRMQRGSSEMAKIAKKSAVQAVESHTTNIMKQALTVGIQKYGNKDYLPPKSAKVKKD